MKDIPLHPETTKGIKTLVNRAPHAIMLVGNEGSGKGYVSSKIATEFLKSSPENHPYFLEINPEGKSITIDQIRELQNFVKLRTTGSGAIRRVVIIKDAHQMTTEAQNALLKLLEEPPKDTALILTARGDNSLKPTIYSRVQQLHIKPISHDQAVAYAASLGKIKLAERAYSLSSGDAALFSALIDQDSSHELAKAIIDGKQLFAAEPFERLSKVDELGKDKESLATLLLALKRIATAGLKAATHKQDPRVRKQWLSRLAAIYDCEASFGKSTNTKLLLTDLFLSI